MLPGGPPAQKSPQKHQFWEDCRDQSPAESVIMRGGMLDFMEGVAGFLGGCVASHSA